MKKLRFIMGIETSCDDTGIAIYDALHQKVLSNTISSQYDIHPYGVQCELAARAHIENLLPVLTLSLKESLLEEKDIDAIAYTSSPGLVNSLITGACFAKALAYTLDIPSVSVHHIRAHILSAFIGETIPQEPFISVVLSGGHSHIYLVKHPEKYLLIGQTLDDAVGEILDKAAKIMGFLYPGGPKIEQLALKGKKGKFNLPIPMIRSKKDLNLSFSGIKSAFARAWESSDQTDQDMFDLSLDLQEKVIVFMMHKIKRALALYDVKLISFVGGVSRNLFFQSQLSQLAIECGVQMKLAKMDYCQDNGAMVAFTGYHQICNGFVDQDLTIKIMPRRDLF